MSWKSEQRAKLSTHRIGFKCLMDTRVSLRGVNATSLPEYDGRGSGGSARLECTELTVTLLPQRKGMAETSRRLMFCLFDLSEPVRHQG